MSARKSNSVIRKCLECGFPIGGGRTCPKCGADPRSMTDGSWRTVDIGHHGQTVNRAMENFERTLENIHLESAQYLRVITGRGRIAGQLQAHLRALAASGQIISYQTEEPAGGSFVVKLKRVAGPRRGSTGRSR